MFRKKQSISQEIAREEKRPRFLSELFEPAPAQIEPEPASMIEPLVATIEKEELKPLEKIFGKSLSASVSFEQSVEKPNIADRKITNLITNALLSMLNMQKAINELSSAGMEYDELIELVKKADSFSISHEVDSDESA